jgi:uncharacterized protein YjbJ (UPF0337 family)
MDKHPDELKGEVKEGVGKVIENKDLEEEGRTDQAEGKVKGAIDKTSEEAKKLADKIRDKFLDK